MNKSLYIQLFKVRQFLMYILKRFWFDHCGYRASALTYTTLLSIVPLMLVTLSISSAFPVFKNLADNAQNYIFKNFVPAAGQTAQVYLQTFVEQASKLPVVGLAFLVLMAVLLMYTIDRAMNSIWEVDTRRKGVSSFILYWAVLTLTPLLVGMSLTISAYFVNVAEHSWALRILPFMLALIAFSFLYIAVPNCKVKFLHGFAGAFFAAVLFELAKIGFTYYLQHYPNYNLIYGAFAMIPIFFLWVYIVWLIILLGGEFAHAFSVQYARRLGEPLDPFVHAFHWLKHLWQAQQQGQTLSMQELIALDTDPYVIPPNQQISTLLEVNLIQSTANNAYCLARDLSAMSFSELRTILPWKCPSYSPSLEAPLNTLLQQTEASHAALWSVKVADLF